MNHLKVKCEAIQKDITINFYEQTDRQALLTGIAAGHNEYVELKHSVHVDRI